MLRFHKSKLMHRIGMSGMVPSLGMDNMMMSQGLFGGFDGSGIGVQGTSMNIDGGFPPWSPNVGDNFGANVGYHPTGGYNQQSHHGQFNHMQRAQFNQNFNQNRFRGQSHRRGYGQGRDQQSFLDRPRSQSHIASDTTTQYDQQQPYSALNDGPPAKEDSASVKDEPVHEVVVAGQPQENTDQRQDDVRTMHEQPTNSAIGRRSNDDDSATKADFLANGTPSFKGVSTGWRKHVSNGLEMADQSFPAADVSMPVAPAAQSEQPGRARLDSRSSNRGAMESRGSGRDHGTMPNDENLHRFRHVVELTPAPTTIVPKGPGVSGAPTGPKAMREGHPNVGFKAARGGFQAGNRAVAVKYVTGTSTSTLVPSRYVSQLRI